MIIHLVILVHLFFFVYSYVLNIVKITNAEVIKKFFRSILNFLINKDQHNTVLIL